MMPSLQNNMVKLYYELRVAFGLTSLFPSLLLPLYAFIGLLVWHNRGVVPSVLEITQSFELILSLGAGLASAHLMSIERDESFDELRASYLEKSWYIPVARTLGACFLTLVSIIVSSFIISLIYVKHNSLSILPEIYPPVLFLIGLALLVNNITGSYWVSAAAVVGYWFFEFRTRGEYTGIFFLFRASFALSGVNYEINRLFVWAGGIILVVANAFFNSWRRRNLGGR